MSQSLSYSALWYRLVKLAGISAFLIFFLGSLSIIYQDATGLFLGLLFIGIVVGLFLVFLEFHNLRFSLETHAIILQQGILSLEKVTIPYS